MSEEGSVHWRATWRLITPDLGRYGGLGAIVALGSALALLGPIILASIIDRAAGGAAVATLGLLAGAYLAASVANQAAAVAVSYVGTKVAWRTANELRMRLAAHVLDLDHEYHRSHSPGELIERIDGDVTAVSDFLATVVVKVFGAALLIVGIVVVVATVEWWLGVGVALYALAVALVVFRRRDQAVVESERELSASAALYGGIEERLTAAEDLRANGAGPYALSRFVNDTGNYVGVAIARERAFLRLWRGLQASIVMGTVLALVVGALGVEAGVLTIGNAFLLFQFVQRLQRPLEEISHELDLVQKANGAMARVSRLLATGTAVRDEGQIEPPPGPLAVDFDGVSFHYGDEQTIVDGLDLHLPAGASVGIVGTTGSGKTTLMRLLVRLVDATGGEIRLNGVPIAEVPMADLRQRVAVIGQNVDLLAGTVAQNVSLFRNDVPEADIDAALAQVGLDHLVGRSLVHWLGPGGQGLSAGEGQLLALARVWLHDPDLIVLDEPTARVDPATEARLEEAVAHLFEGRTVVIVAHRLSTLRRVDRIVVVERGEVVETGERASLAADPESRFAALLRTALETDAAEGVEA
ncbi:MAG: ABC transporter ATP-binding protein [Actinomycetota bacterium]